MEKLFWNAPEVFWNIFQTVYYLWSISFKICYVLFIEVKDFFFHQRNFRNIKHIKTGRNNLCRKYCDQHYIYLNIVLYTPQIDDIIFTVTLNSISFSPGKIPLSGKIFIQSFSNGRIGRFLFLGLSSIFQPYFIFTVLKSGFH